MSPLGSRAAIADQMAAATRQTARVIDRRALEAIEAQTADTGMTPEMARALEGIKSRWRVDPL